MSREITTFKCKLENFEAIREKWRKLGYEAYPYDLRNDNTVIVVKCKMKEEGEK